MGAWGTGILQNDTTADIWAEFKELYNNGLSPKEIRIKLEKEYTPEKDEEYYGEIWTGIAYGQWMCGELENYTLKKVKDSTKSKWLTLWEGDKKRVKALLEFFEKIKTPRPNPLKRKKIVKRPVFFKTGDVIGIKINESSYLAAIVVDHSEDPVHGSNEIVLLNLVFQNNKPTQKQILDSNVLYFDIGREDNYYAGYFKAIFSARNMAKKINDSLKLTSLKRKKYMILGVGIPIGDWNKIPELYFEQVTFLKKSKSRMPFPVTVNDLLKPKWEVEKRLIEWDKKLNAEMVAKMRQKLKLNTIN